MGLEETSLIDVINEFREKGFSEEFTIRDNQFFIERLGMGFDQDELVIDGAFRFDISEEVVDTQNLFIISVPQFSIKGMLIDLMGMYTFMEEYEITAILRQILMETYIFDEDAPYDKYGLRRVLPEEFEQNPHRFVLRKGFPDYPPCPIGNEFSMLVYDEKQEQYVWLVTSLLSDPRLRVETYS